MANRIFSGLMALVALVLLYMAWGYHAPIAYDPMGPRPYPVLLLALLIILTLAITLQPSKLSEPSGLGLTRPIIKNLVLCTIVLTLYATLFEILGYIITTTLMAWVVGILFGGHWIKALVASAIMAIATYFLFNGPLEVSLPAGILEPILG